MTRRNVIILCLGGALVAATVAILCTIHLTHQEFHGIAIDQYGAPVAGAKVSGIVTHPSIGWNQPVSGFTTQTDAHGCFTIALKSPDEVDVEIETPGYLSHKKIFYFRGPPDRPPPDLAKPIPFRLWRNGPVEQLLLWRRGLIISPDGQPLYFDVQNGSVVNEAERPHDIAIVARRVQKIPLGNVKFSWDLSIEVTSGGGIQESDDEFMFHAPATGYARSWSIHMDPADPNWTTQLRRQFYIRARDGMVHAAVELRTQAAEGDGRFRVNLDYVANDTGSANLQYEGINKKN
jgi:hypothetical protein